MIEKISGRAEDKKSVKSCFEGVPALALLAQLFSAPADYYATGDVHRVRMLVGNGGTGKTHLLRLLEKEAPVTIYELDKSGLENGKITYVAKSEHEKSAAVIVEDLHYLLKAMHLSRLNGGNLPEGKVLRKIREFESQARTLDTLLIFAADEGPAGLSMRFSDDGNRRKFLEVVDGCTAYGDDATMLMKVLGKHYVTPSFTVNLNYRGLTHWRDSEIPPEVALRLWPEEVKKALDSVFPPVPVHQSQLEIERRFSALTSRGLLAGMSQARYKALAGFAEDMDVQIRRECWQMPARVATALRITDIPLAYRASLRNALYQINGDSTIDSAVAYTSDLLGLNAQAYLDTPIATIRELEVVSNELGGINRELLGLGKLAVKKLMTSDGKKGYVWYANEELQQISRKIKEVFNRTAKYDRKDYVRRLLSSETDSGFLSGIVRADLEME